MLGSSGGVIREAGRHACALCHPVRECSAQGGAEVALKMLPWRLGVRALGCVRCARALGVLGACTYLARSSGGERHRARRSHESQCAQLLGTQTGSDLNVSKRVVSGGDEGGGKSQSGDAAAAVVHTVPCLAGACAFEGRHARPELMHHCTVQSLQARADPQTVFVHRRMGQLRQGSVGMPKKRKHQPPRAATVESDHPPPYPEPPPPPEPVLASPPAPAPGTVARSPELHCRR